MKILNRKMSTLLILFILIIMLGQLINVNAEESISKDTALYFVENVLPLDVEKYNIAVSRYYSYSSIDANLNDGINEEVVYSLDSEESKLEITCKFRNNIFWSFRLNIKEGEIIYDRSYSSAIDIASSFLNRYQNFAKKSSTEMINLLSISKTTKNMTVKSGNLKFSVENLVIPDIVNVASFCWTDIYDGVEYTSITIYFENGNLQSVIDDRGLYDIGNTGVVVSKEEAIEIAMKRIESYSYSMLIGDPDNPKSVEISDFTIKEDEITADLYSTPRDSSTLYPYWSVILNLNQTYPGSIYALIVGMWADSGEVFLCSNLGASGSQLIDDSNTSSLGIEQYQGSPNSIYLMLAILVVVIFVTLITVFKLKKKSPSFF